LSKLLFFGEGILRGAINEPLEHYHRDCSHQGSGNMLPMPAMNPSPRGNRPIRRRERLGGLL